MMTADRSRSLPPELLTAREVARLMHICVKTLYRLVRSGVVPPPMRLGPKILRWRTEMYFQYRRLRADPAMQGT